VVQGQPVTLEDSVMTVYVIMTLIAVNQQHPLCNDSSIGPRELLLRLFVPIGFWACTFLTSTGLVFQGYELCRQVTIYVSGVSVADTTQSFES